MMNRTLAITLLFLMCFSASSFAQKKEKSGNTRSLQGTVSDTENNPVNGAVVQLKETKSLQVRSFITKQDGAYFFTGLNTNVDYEVKSEYQGFSSDTKTLSNFNSQKTPVINLQIKSKK